MIIEEVHLERYGPISRLDETFVTTNCVIGLNGAGKTMLLSLLAGVAGNDEASGLIQGQHTKSFSIRLSHEGKHFEFKTTGEFDIEEVSEFKNTLPKRLNFGLTEWGKTFPAHCVDLATAREEWRTYLQAHTEPYSRYSATHAFVYHPSSGSVAFQSGDGDRFAMSLFFNDSEAGVPSLYDRPDRHMDLMGKRLMTEMLCRHDRQFVYTVHNPEMIPKGVLNGDEGDQKIIDLSKS